MERDDAVTPVRIGTDRDGVTTYWMERRPETLPAVRSRDLEIVLDAARSAANAARWGGARGFCFRPPDGDAYDLALVDPDAQCWAAAVEATLGMHSSYGVAVCLRLFALLHLLARVPWAAGLVPRRGAPASRLHPSLLRAAACTPLNGEAGFDEAAFLDRLPVFMVPRPGDRHGTPARLTGAPV